MSPYNIIKPIYSTLVIVLTLFFYSPSASAFDIFLGTAEPGTFSNFSGRMIERIIKKQVKGINCKVIPGSGDIHNLTNLQQGSLDIALIDSRMLYDAINKTGYFQFLAINYKNICLLAPLYDVPITLIVDQNTGIKKLGDLKGKRINAGGPLSPQNLLFETISTAKSWSKKDFKLVAEISESQSQDTMAFCHGDIDAMLHIGIHPAPAVQQLFKLCNAGMADMNDSDIDKLISRHPAFSSFTIPSGTYPDQTTNINTLGTQTLLVASQDLDKETVYKILYAISSNQKMLSTAHPALSLQKPDIAKTKSMGIKLHAGAVKYFNRP